MWPTLYDFDGVPGGPGLHTYGLMMTVAFLAATWITWLRGQRVGIPMERIVPLLIGAIVGGLLGARIFYAVGVADPSALWSASGGFAYYGGLIGGTITVLAVARALRMPLWKTADIIAPALAIGSGFGRLGCLFAGCCHGAPVPGGEHAHALLPEGALQGQLLLHDAFPFLSTSFEGGVARLTDTALYPTQLWQSTGEFALAAFLMWMSGRRRFDGHIIALYLLVQPVLRIFVEGFRADHRGYMVSWQVESIPSWLPPGMSQAGASLGTQTIGLTTSQGIGLLMVATGVLIWWLRHGAGVSEETAVPDTWEDDLADAL